MKSINIWKRINREQITIYRCFQTIPDNKFFVQNQDYYYMDSDTGLISKEKIDYFENQFLELIFEKPPSKESLYDSLEEALENF